MKKFRILLLPLAAIIEIFTLLACWVAAFTAPARAEKLAAWADRSLPNFSWYLGK